MKVGKFFTKIGTVLIKVASVCLAAFILYKVATVCYDYGFRIFAEKPVDREPGIDVNVAIVEGKSVKEIGKLLEEKGLIRSGDLFVWQEKFSEYSGDLKPGVYTLNTSQTPYEMMAIMSAETEPEETDKTVTASEEEEESEEESEPSEAEFELNEDGGGEGQENPEAEGQGE